MVGAIIEAGRDFLTSINHPRAHGSFLLSLGDVLHVACFLCTRVSPLACSVHAWCPCQGWPASSLWVTCMG